MELIKGLIKKAVKTCLYAVEGIGKSTFASQFPDPLFIDTEDSTVMMDVTRFPKPTSWTMILSQIEHVKRNPDICKTLVIDTADWAEKLCSEHVCAKGNVNSIEDFGYGKGYVYLEEEFGRFLNKLQEIIEIGINVVIIAHAEIKKVEQPEEIGGFDHWQLKLEKKTMPLLKEWSDILLFANYKVYVVNVDNQGAAKGKNKAQGGKRVMYTTHSPWWDAKNRHNLKDELPFDYKEIAHCIPVRVVKQETKSQVVTKIEPPVIEHVKSEPTPPEIKPVPPKQEQPKETPLGSVPKPLADLMKVNNVTVEEIQKAVASKGYYPIDAPIANYDPNFINGVLVAAWPQVFGMIEKIRIDDALPF